MRILFCLLLFTTTASSQSFYFPGDSAVVSTIDLPATQPFDSSRAYYKVKGPYVYIISDKDLYDHFGYDISMKFHQFNFHDFHILGALLCNQCLAGCDHRNGERNCHRNACIMEWVWVKRENKKAFTAVPSITVPRYQEKGQPQYRDTVITATGDTASWYTTGHGDCFARYTYALIADKYHHALILKEWNHYGGCRAGGSKPVTIVFKEPEGVLFKTKRTILVQKKGY